MQALEKASPVQVELVDGQITTTSLDVAAHFKKRHDTVLRAIRLLECSAEFIARNFAAIQIDIDLGIGRTRKGQAYRMTRDGFAFLAMGFTGKEAAKWKEAYINAFNRLEQELRKHDSMAADTIVNELIGMTEVNVIKGLIRDKAKVIPIDRRRGFQLAMHNRLHTRFNVPRVELIPAAQFESACNFIAAYALEGEWLPKEEKKGGIYLDDYETHHLYLLMSRFAIMSEHRGNMLAAARSLDSKPLWTIFGQIDEGRASFSSLDKRRDEIYSIYCKNGLRGGYAMTA